MRQSMREQVMNDLASHQSWIPAKGGEQRPVGRHGRRRSAGEGLWKERLRQEGRKGGSNAKDGKVAGEQSENAGKYSWTAGNNSWSSWGGAMSERLGENREGQVAWRVLALREDRALYVSSCTMKGAFGQSVASASQADTMNVAGVTEGRLPTIKDVCRFHVKRETHESPRDECSAMPHMLIVSGTSFPVGPAYMLHRPCGRVLGRRLTTVAGESMEYDGQAPARVMSEIGDTIHAECEASNVQRFVLVVVQIVDKGVEVNFSPSGRTLIAPAEQVNTESPRPLSFSPIGLVAPVEIEEAFRRTIEPLDQGEEERVPVLIRPPGMQDMPDNG